MEPCEFGWAYFQSAYLAYCVKIIVPLKKEKKKKNFKKLHINKIIQTN